MLQGQSEPVCQRYGSNSKSYKQSGGKNGNDETICRDDLSEIAK